MYIYIEREMHQCCIHTYTHTGATQSRHAPARAQEGAGLACVRGRGVEASNNIPATQPRPNRILLLEGERQSADGTHASV